MVAEPQTYPMKLEMTRKIGAREIMSEKIPNLVSQHRDAGHFISVKGHNIFVRDEGQGIPVLLVHGVPTSSFLYRKMIPLLAGTSFRAISFDFPGLGLSDKPQNISYDWHSLSNWMGHIVETLGIEKLHLVVHDIGGPVGMEWAINHPQCVQSITIMNTIMNLPAFSKPFPMWLYCVPFIRHFVFATQNVMVFKPIMKRVGVYDISFIDDEMVYSYLWLLKHKHGRKPFLDIMGGFDLSEEHAVFLKEGIKRLSIPIQLLWGEKDKAIPKAHAHYIIEELKISDAHWLAARHFPQEDHAQRCVDHIEAFVRKFE